MGVNGVKCEWGASGVRCEWESRCIVVCVPIHQRERLNGFKSTHSQYFPELKMCIYHVHCYFQSLCLFQLSLPSLLFSPSPPSLPPSPLSHPPSPSVRPGSVSVTSSSSLDICRPTILTPRLLPPAFLVL